MGGTAGAQDREDQRSGLRAARPGGRAFAAFGVDLQLLTAVALVPIAAVGHVLGLRVHDAILNNQRTFQRWIGAGLMVVCVVGLVRLW